jgi:hypothetical protein
MTDPTDGAVHRRHVDINASVKRESCTLDKSAKLDAIWTPPHALTVELVEWAHHCGKYPGAVGLTFGGIERHVLWAQVLRWGKSHIFASQSRVDFSGFNGLRVKSQGLSHIVTTIVAYELSLFADPDHFPSCPASIVR